MKRTLSILTGLGLVVALTIGTAGAVSAASAPPFTIDQTSITYTAQVGLYQQGWVTVTTAKKPVVLESPTSFASGAEFLDVQRGTCWGTYGSLGLPIPIQTSCTVFMPFHPTAVGTFTDTATIYSCKKWHVAAGHTVCDIRDGSRTVSLSGVGTEPWCAFDADQTGCAVFNNEFLPLGGSGPSGTTITGSITFAPVSASWDSSTTATVSGSGSWTTTSGRYGTWTATDKSSIYPTTFGLQAGPFTSCALSDTRYLGVHLDMYEYGTVGLAGEAEVGLRMATWGINGIQYQGFTATPGVGGPWGLHSTTNVNAANLLC
jgi:hypothetical protein